MRRFTLNRWWVFLLALVLSLGMSATFVSRASALITVRQSRLLTGMSNGYGDPDAPGSGVDGNPMPGRVVPSGSSGGVGQAAGDSRTSPGVERTLHLRILLDLIRALLFRF